VIEIVNIERATTQRVTMVEDKDTKVSPLINIQDIMDWTMNQEVEQIVVNIII
jgi:hypothetical protein